MINGGNERFRQAPSAPRDSQRDPKGEPLFPITFICALRIGEEVGTFVRERPLAAVGIALFAGFMIGRIARRL